MLRAFLQFLLSPPVPLPFTVPACLHYLPAHCLPATLSAAHSPPPLTPLRLPPRYLPAFSTMVRSGLLLPAFPTPQPHTTRTLCYTPTAACCMPFVGFLIFLTCHHACATYYLATLVDFCYYCFPTCTTAFCYYHCPVLPPYHRFGSAHTVTLCCMRWVGLDRFTRSATPFYRAVLPPVYTCTHLRFTGWFYLPLPTAFGFLYAPARFGYYCRFANCCLPPPAALRARATAATTAYLRHFTYRHRLPLHRHYLYHLPPGLVTPPDTCAPHTFCCCLRCAAACAPPPRSCTRCVPACTPLHRAWIPVFCRRFTTRLVAAAAHTCLHLPLWSFPHDSACLPPAGFTPTCAARNLLPACRLRSLLRRRTFAHTVTSVSAPPTVPGLYSCLSACILRSHYCHFPHCSFSTACLPHPPQYTHPFTTTHTPIPATACHACTAFLPAAIHCLLLSRSCHSPACLFSTTAIQFCTHCVWFLHTRLIYISFYDFTICLLFVATPTSPVPATTYRSQFMLLHTAHGTLGVLYFLDSCSLGLHAYTCFSATPATVLLCLYCLLSLVLPRTTYLRSVYSFAFTFVHHSTRVSFFGLLHYLPDFYHLTCRFTCPYHLPPNYSCLRSTTMPFSIAPAVTHIFLPFYHTCLVHTYTLSPLPTYCVYFPLPHLLLPVSLPSLYTILPVGYVYLPG